MNTASTQPEDPQAGLRAIMLDQTRGAADVLRLAVDWLVDHPDSLSIDQADRTMGTLARTRPAMACFAVLARRIENAWRMNPDRTPDEILAAMKDQILLAERKVAESSIAALRALAPLRVVTMCNSSTVLRTLMEGHDLVASVRVVEGPEPQPVCEMAERGRELFGDLRRIPLEELEAAVADCNVGLLGADTVFIDGAVLNGSGSLALAECLQRQGKPLQVIATSWKHSEQRSTDRVIDPATHFDLIPSTLITHLFTDK